METRLLVERHAADRLARRAARAAGVIADLRRDPRRASERLLDAGDLRPAFVAADRDFHHTIVAAAGNAILTRISDSLRDRQRRMGATTVARDPELAERFVAEHRAIVDALERGDGDGAGGYSRATSRARAGPSGGSAARLTGRPRGRA